MEEEQDMNEFNTETPPSESHDAEEMRAQGKAATDELNDKYLRLYAEFENYKKRVIKDKEELTRYGNESLILALLPILDSLELALKHTTGAQPAGLVQGVEMTLKELQKSLEKFGLIKIEAIGKLFDPSVHHAMTQVEREDCEDKMVAEELRPGYLYRDKVLRPSLVAVSMKPQKKTEHFTTEGAKKKAHAEDDAPDNINNNITMNIEED